MLVVFHKRGALLCGETTHTRDLWWWCCCTGVHLDAVAAPPACPQVLPTALRGAFQCSGQNCMGAERFIVQERVFDEFVRLVALGV